MRSGCKVIVKNNLEIWNKLISLWLFSNKEIKVYKIVNKTLNLNLIIQRREEWVHHLKQKLISCIGKNLGWFMSQYQIMIIYKFLIFSREIQFNKY